MEYVPFLGIIPGAARLYFAWNCKNDSDTVNYYAMRFFKLEIHSSEYSPFNQSIRGLVTVTPVINLILIPVDLGIAIYCAFFRPPTPLENFKQLQKSLSYLQGWYKEDQRRIIAKQEGKETSYLSESLYEHNPEVPKEIIKAFKYAYLLMQKCYSFSKPSDEEVWQRNEDIWDKEQSKTYSQVSFYHALSRIDAYYNSSCSAKKLSPFYFVGCSGDCPESGAARYVRDHCETVLAVIYQKIVELS